MTDPANGMFAISVRIMKGNNMSNKERKARDIVELETNWRKADTELKAVEKMLNYMRYLRDTGDITRECFLKKQEEQTALALEVSRLFFVLGNAKLELKKL